MTRQRVSPHGQSTSTPRGNGRLKPRPHPYCRHHRTHVPQPRPLPSRRPPRHLNQTSSRKRPHLSHPDPNPIGQAKPHGPPLRALKRSKPHNSGGPHLDSRHRHPAQQTHRQPYPAPPDGGHNTGPQCTRSRTRVGSTQPQEGYRVISGTRPRETTNPAAASSTRARASSPWRSTHDQRNKETAYERWDGARVQKALTFGDAQNALRSSAQIPHRIEQGEPWRVACKYDATATRSTKEEQEDHMTCLQTRQRGLTKQPRPVIIGRHHSKGGDHR